MNHLNAYLEKREATEYNSAAIAYLASLDTISANAPDIANSIISELQDERSHIKLIASENFSSYPVQLAMGNLLTDKYAEGYVHHRFYAGCRNVDAIEQAAVDELKKLYNAEYAYVQPHSGADANLVALWSILVHRIQNPEVEKLGGRLEDLTPEQYEKIRQLMVNQKLMGMSLNAGGHLSHGYIHNVSSKMMRSVSYDVDPKTELIDYSQLSEQVKKEKPTILLAGYSAYPRNLNFAKLREIADSVDATLMVDMAHFSGLVAGKVLTGDLNPIPFADIVTSTTHKTLRGPRGGIILAKKEFEEIINKGCPLLLGGPLPHVIAAKAIAFREANTPEFQSYSKQIVTNAKAMAERFQKRGLRIVTGGTENHLIIVDLTSLGLTGRQAELALRQSGITLNRNTIPFDQNGAWYTSGIRVGTPAITTLGMGATEAELIADLLVDVLTHTKPATVEKTGEKSKAKFTIDEQVQQKTMGQISELLEQFPLYPEIELSNSAHAQPSFS